MIHQRFYPAGTIDQFGGGYDVFCSTIFHLRQKPQSCDFSVCHSAQEKDESRSVFTRLTCKQKSMFPSSTFIQS